MFNLRRNISHIRHKCSIAFINRHWYRLATQEDLQNNFQTAVQKIQKSIEERQKRGIDVTPDQIFQQKVKAYKKLLKAEFNYLIDNFSTDPDADMQQFILSYDG